ncbi:MAG: hypothetical protein RIS50_1481 [Bacteroidota bacterium]
MAKLEKKRLTTFAIIGMVTIVVVVGLWLGQNKQRSSTEPQTQIDSSQDIELLEEPSDCLPMVTAAEGGGPEKIKLPKEGIPNTLMVSFSAMFSEAQAKEFNKHSFMGLFYDSSNQHYATKRITDQICPSGLLDSENDLEPVFHWPIANEPMVMEPGKSIKFSAKEYNYLLRATDQVAEITGANHHSDYTLVLRSQKKTGGPVNEVLISYIPWFDDGAVTLLFLGDLDGDGYPDLLIDNAYKYTETGESGVLFLTKKSKLHGLPEPITLETRGSKVEETEGQFVFYGC